MAKKKPTKMLAVLGRSRRGGRWSVASQSSVLACLGTCDLDMRRSSVDGETFKMKVTVVLGTATFVLPPGASVKPSGLTMLAGSLVDVPETEDVCDLPTLEIEWSTILGRIRIVTRSLDDDEPDEPPIEVTEVESGSDDQPPAVAPSAPLTGVGDSNEQTESAEPAEPVAEVGDAIEAEADTDTDTDTDEAAQPALDLESGGEENATNADDQPEADGQADAEDTATELPQPSEEVERHAEAVEGEGESGRGRRSDDSDSDADTDTDADTGADADTGTGGGDGDEAEEQTTAG